MGHFSDVYGYILGIGDHYDHNAGRIRALPASDRSAYLSPDMFAIPLREHCYDSQLIAFGRTYKGVEVYWEQWLAEFEVLLRTMYWDEACVRLRTEYWGTYRYLWIPVNSDQLPPGTVPQPTQVWTFSGGPRSGLRDQYRKDDDAF